ncbi:MAG: hypothetical protein ABIJ50_01450 [Pseudomonadota bacterium]
MKSLNQIKEKIDSAKKAGGADSAILTFLFSHWSLEFQPTA